MGRPGTFKQGNQAAVGAGRRTRPCTQTLIALLNEVDRKTKKSAIYEIGEQLVQKARAGDMDAIKYVMDRTDGRPPQFMELASDPDNPIVPPSFAAKFEDES
jgi:hypothetical protein